ncbi:MAG: alpha-galactosidase [Chloroflexi bacterium]|nr:MAG: alpha-galactosidase [Chloroflexota bacterium]
MSSNKLNFHLTAEGNHLRLDRFAGNGSSWLNPALEAGLFSVFVDGKSFSSANLPLVSLGEDPSVPGVQHQVARCQSPELAVDYHVLRYDGTALLELWPVARNTTQHVQRITRLDSLSLPIPARETELLSFTGNWGVEFEPQTTILSGTEVIQSRSGRSSKGNHPWFTLYQAGAGVLSGAVAWSGNWVFRFEPLAEGGYRISGGLNDWEFYKDLRPGEEMEGPHVVLVLGDDLNAVSQQYASVGRKHWYPRNALSAKAPVEWNHWWPYEDVEINEEVFQRNVEVAARLGMEVCTLDAGWFGPSDPATHWYEYRGDWDLVNQPRFPHGIRPLADLVHARGMAFGLWCEIEGLGIHAKLAVDHPDYPAIRQGERLGYVCFGNPDVQEWAFQTLSRLITEYQADWIKLDFNLDPGAGCDRTDHGHGAGDGLYAHYMGYYRTLERIRQAFPEVVLENCSSGGLRIDLGILRRTDFTYLSDPDWPVHDLQIFWGASGMLAPDALLHWGYGEWRSKNPPPQQRFNPRDPNLTPRQFDYYTRISMLNVYGFSQKLPDLPDWMLERIKLHTRIYKEHVRRFVREADLYRLTPQPLRSGQGERLCAFQYSLPGSEEHLLFVFRLPGEVQQGKIYLLNLLPARTYQIEGFENEPSRQATGRELMEHGLDFRHLVEEESVLLSIR